jgi:hypothetical protein
MYDPCVLRALLIVTCLVGCKKKEREMATELPPTPSTGHSITHFKDASDPPEENGSAGTASANAASTTPIDAAPVSGAAAYRDSDGRVHGPGGPVNLGKGHDCDAAHEHCMRDGVWFAAGNYQQGKLFRAVPSFEFEGKWYNFRGDPIDDGGKLLKTKVAKPGDVRAGEPIVVFTPEDNPRDKWVNVEDDALTSSRWDVVVPDSVNGNTFTTKAWPDPIDIDTARVVVEQKAH